MKRLLWLDDIRDPNNDVWLNWLINENVNVLDYHIIWVKSYNAFTNYVIKNGLPDLICFDHDLGEDVSIDRVNQGMSKKQARNLKKETLSGFDCTKWLVEYCLNNKKHIPNYKIQSANPVGVENIKYLIENFRKNVSF
jgi:hypothetical protein